MKKFLVFILFLAVIVVTRIHMSHKAAACGCCDE